MTLPGGLVEGAFRLRDNFLRRLADRRGIHVPSLVADSLQADDDPLASPSATDEIGTGAHELVDCPECGARMPPDEMLLHKHFRSGNGHADDHRSPLHDEDVVELTEVRS